MSAGLSPTPHQTSHFWRKFSSGESAWSLALRDTDTSRPRFARRPLCPFPSFSGRSGCRPGSKPQRPQPFFSVPPFLRPSLAKAWALFALGMETFCVADPVCRCAVGRMGAGSRLWRGVTPCPYSPLPAPGWLTRIWDLHLEVAAWTWPPPFPSPVSSAFKFFYKNFIANKS